MMKTFVREAYPLPVDATQVEHEWRERGFSFGVFNDPPGQEWNDFIHSTDEYVVVAEGQLEIRVGDETAIVDAGDLVHIPKGTLHSLKTLSGTGSTWLYGYGHWQEGRW